MGICYIHSLFYLILFAIPFRSSALQLSHRRHPHHLSNASDQEALLGFMSGITYDPFQSLSTHWNPNVSFCEWTGITCNRRRQRVVSLDVSDMELQEYGLGVCATTKGDVYSYGIVLLQMLTGKKPTDNMFVEGINLQKWVGSSFPDKVGEVVDKGLLRRTSTITEEDKEHKCLSHLMTVGLLCTKESPERRPNMIDIVSQLQSIKDVFLGVCISNFQSDIMHLFDSTSTTHTNIGGGRSSSSTS